MISGVFLLTGVGVPPGPFPGGGGGRTVHPISGQESECLRYAAVGTNLAVTLEDFLVFIYYTFGQFLKFNYLNILRFF